MMRTLTTDVPPLEKFHAVTPVLLSDKLEPGAGCSSSQVGHRRSRLTDPSPSAGPHNCCCRSSVPPARSAGNLGSRQISGTSSSGKQSAGSRRQGRPPSRKATPQRRTAAAFVRLLALAAGNCAAHRSVQPCTATGPAAPLHASPHMLKVCSFSALLADMTDTVFPKCSIASFKATWLWSSGAGTQADASMLFESCAGDRSAKRLRLLAEASLQHCLLAAAAAAEEEQQQQERAAEQLYHCQHGEKGGKPAADHASVWGQPMKPMKPQVDAEADLLHKAAADAVRLAEGKCQVRLGAASPDVCEARPGWPGNHGQRYCQRDGDAGFRGTDLLCYAVHRLQPRRPGAQ
jgi:hypothetical protein